MFDSSQNIRLIADVTELEKDSKGHVGIAIGGGAPYCPCLYIVQIFENSPAKRNGLIGVGDEIVAVNGENLKGYEKTSVASLIRETEGPLRISFNRLQFDTDKSKSLDILLKKFKQRLIDTMDDTTADALGLSRAILCNDILADLQARLEQNQHFYQALIKKAEETMKYYQQTSATQNVIGALLNEMSTREGADSAGHESPDVIKSMINLSVAHKLFSREHSNIAITVSEMIRALQSHANAAIPDVKQSLRKYLDAKYEYLAFCLRVKEMEDEEAETALAGEYLERMANGNYEYRLTLKNREQSRFNFLDKRKQVAVKIELLDEKHVRELALQLKTFINVMKSAHSACLDHLEKSVC